MDMKPLSKMKGKLGIVALSLAITLLAACSLVGTSASGLIGDTISTPSTTPTPSTACHATGNPANPYIVITVTYDIHPVPANGCPTGPVFIGDGKVLICHATGSQTNPFDKTTVSLIGLNGHGTHTGDVFPDTQGNCPTILGVIAIEVTPPLTVCHATGDLAKPYEELTVTSAELDAHLRHPGDINPAPANGCPASAVLFKESKITICHATSSENNPYNEINVSANGLNGHGTHAGDLIPAPADGCPVKVIDTAAKITICHATSSQTNPYNEITVSINGLNGHDKHPGDIIPAPANGCPASPVLSNGGKITICHATSSQSHPYNEITVSINGLNGHNKHAGDIIPAPAGGCPTTPQINKGNNGNNGNGNKP